ncbi:MAG TPA: SPOR domain-containing protein [Longimicrobiales bacterium]|nr:SPOR domain-containing protein [Longimicrobiales bacterium]
MPFDPGSGEIPPGLESVFSDPDRPILLLVAADPDDAAARAAIALAAARAGRGLPTVLAEADLDAPRLHRLLDVPNLEGLVDVFLFGASLERIAVRPEAFAFDFAPAGAYAPDPAEVLQSPRWDRIAEELTGDGALLMVFVPAAAPGARELSRRIGRAVVLGNDAAAARAMGRLDPACAILGALDPAPTPVQEPEGVPAPAESVARGAPRAPGRPDLTEPVVIRKPRKQRNYTPLVLLGLLAALAAGAWFGYRQLFGDEPAAAAVAPEAAGPGERGAPVETAIPYSVAVEAHQEMEPAVERVRGLQRAEPAIGFFVAPLSVQGRLYYRVLAGPVADREAATALMQRLVVGGHKTDMDDWALLATTHAFHLGDYETMAEARSRVLALSAAGIPSYTVPQRYESGQYRYRVYGGAYQNEAEADVMREMLENAGESARLVERVGEPVA